ncbi:LacI family DNA-binding transcriptional regulator [Klebsiella pneumoniae]|uniref:LacI family DNA-binding transcriptional regulator n=1 Tax=Klebsiella pneumoniae TaxID=573 RepID=UPI001ABC871D|nr:LacI family DNA-binding transcriptional regulator [Klebsiella pneumoniae]MBO3721274.1 LacI family DNA-binding transcriptional regulator [Klebsiella pneumoniae]HCM5830604.1 LacI family DNA-binding transcriptional regulator [Klebsiella pneumoniae]
MSIQKIAHLAGVSVATVSRVLNNKNSVKIKNRERVLHAIEQCNYQPNLLARQLRTAKSKMLLVLVPDITNSFYASVVRGIENEAGKNGYSIILNSTDSKKNNNFPLCLTLLSGKVVDGIITIGSFSNFPDLLSLIGDQPWVQCDIYGDSGEASVVGIDYYQATRHVFEHFINNGKTRVALINYGFTGPREKAYKDVIEENGLTFFSISYVNELTFEAGKRAMDYLLQCKNKPDSVFALSDILAAGVLRSIQENNLLVPDDISLVGFGDTELGFITTPQISTLKSPAMQIGQEAIKLVMFKIENPEHPLEKKILDWTFLQRQSS